MWALTRVESHFFSHNLNPCHLKTDDKTLICKTVKRFQRPRILCVLFILPVWPCPLKFCTPGQTTILCTYMYIFYPVCWNSSLGSRCLLLKLFSFNPCISQGILILHCVFCASVSSMCSTASLEIKFQFCLTLVSCDGVEELDKAFLTRPLFLKSWDLTWL